MQQALDDWKGESLIRGRRYAPDDKYPDSNVCKGEGCTCRLSRRNESGYCGTCWPIYGTPRRAGGKYT